MEEKGSFKRIDRGRSKKVRAAEFIDSGARDSRSFQTDVKFSRHGTAAWRRCVSLLCFVLILSRRNCILLSRRLTPFPRPHDPTTLWPNYNLDLDADGSLSEEEVNMYRQVQLLSEKPDEPVDV